MSTLLPRSPASDPLIRAHEDLMSELLAHNLLLWTPSADGVDRERLKVGLRTSSDRFVAAMRAYLIEHDAAFGR